MVAHKEGLELKKNKKKKTTDVASFTFRKQKHVLLIELFDFPARDQ